MVRLVPVVSGLALVLSTLTLSACSAPVPTAAAAAAAASATATPAPLKKIVLPKHPTVYFFGDSWTHGTSAATGRGFPHVVGEALGWKVVLGPDESGAGYVHTYNPAHPIFLEEVRKLAPIHADLVIIEGGVNDVPGSPTLKLWDTARATVKALRKKAGGAPIIMVGPVFPDGTVPPGIGGMNWEQAGVAKQLGIPFISPVNEDWFNTTNVKTLIDQATQHPNTAGHAYYGGRLASDLALLTTQR